MTVVPATKSTAIDLPCNGDKMTREEFHRVYEQTPDGFTAELVGGIVYVASPLKRQHGIPHGLLVSLLNAYVAQTPGTETSDNTTVLLGEEGEPQPDAYLRITPEAGGQSATSLDDYVEGPPELVTEIALSSRAIDLHAKLDDYRRYGVQEYIVVVPRDNRVRWFNLASNSEEEIAADGIIRSSQFPGLWLHTDSIGRNDYLRAMTVLNEGLQSPEHAAFVERLRDALAKRQPKNA